MEDRCRRVWKYYVGLTFRSDQWDSALHSDQLRAYCQANKFQFRRSEKTGKARSIFAVSEVYLG